MLCVLLLSCLVVCDVVSSSSSSSSSYPHPGWNPSYYARFPNGVPSSMDYFPIGVWLQNASNAQGFKVYPLISCIHTYIIIFLGHFVLSRVKNFQHVYTLV
eukprot:TRINITY_DN2948_c0_g1_i2.p1 TRINITY_DN2948_c0_g1~~TRINITY_DN2948_c0_g1_i2.p1  ORF type:complete len:101 (+),score=23.91 TRINITY_DN2948_c0_g1_i2:59-361(+)